MFKNRKIASSLTPDLADSYLNHTSSATWTDSVSSGSAYLYRVCAADGSNNCTSSYSNVALGVAVTFTDDPLYGLSEVSDPASATTIKASHINELRTAVNAVRYLAVVDNATYSHPNPTPQVSLIYVDDVRELRTKLNEALTVLHLDTPPFTDATLVGLSETSNPANATPVKAIHIRELRERLKGTLGSSCYKSIDQFVKDFYQGVLQRQPTASELSSASSTLSTAQAQSASALITAAQNLGASLFNSSEYAGLSTSNAQFVTDNYWGFLQRAPDTSGYNYWLGLLNGGYTRANMITAFQTSGEFTENVKALCRAAGGGSITGSIHWMVADQLGTPRMILDASGSLVNETRHDYLPFGEELTAGFGNRTTGLGFTSADAVRQKFTQKERDIETGLDYFLARYHSIQQGRFTSADPSNPGGRAEDPQSWNAYAYARNNPLKYQDPDGREFKICDLEGHCATVSDDEAKLYTFNKEYQKKNGYYTRGDGKIYSSDGSVIGTYENLGCDCWTDAQKRMVTGIAEELGKPSTYLFGAAAAIARVRAFGRPVKPVNLPASRQVMVDMVHVAEGHMKDGVRAVASKASGKGKSMFPDWMSIDQVESTILDAYEHSTVARVQGTRVVLNGETKDGTIIEMWFDRATNVIETAYPVGRKKR